MDLYPSIDIREGKVVRLARGDYSAQTTYDDDPVAVARRFEAAGARWIHVVDLDAARDGGNPNLRSIEAICAAVSANVQASGGVRTVEDANERYAAGARRVVLGTAAVSDPEIVAALSRLHPGQVALGLDAYGREVKIRGWTEGTGLDVVETARRFEDVAVLIVTEISRDGMLGGPAVELYEELLVAVDTPLIASGGVGTLDDLRALARLPLAGVIVGRAIYEHRFTVEEGIAVCSAFA
jgi:phosphoribosylformimino-5-aminoimidazole carboxamide ribotide isomerase